MHDKTIVECKQTYLLILSKKFVLHALNIKSKSAITDRPLFKFV